MLAVVTAAPSKNLWRESILFRLDCVAFLINLGEACRL
jgi:hypothetical protein